MNQIPNIEETNSRKVEEMDMLAFIEIDGVAIGLFKYDGGVSLTVSGSKEFVKDIPLFHQQLQKDRQDWLREEIVKLDSMLIKEYMKGSPAQYQNKVILEIMKRYQSELDQPN